MAADDHVLVQHLGQAVRLALANADAGQPPFGAVLAVGEHVLATGVNTVPGDRDPTAHAEVAAVRAWFRTAGTAVAPAGAVIAASAEPCPMCRAVAALVGIERIVFAAGREAAVAAGFVLDPVAAALRERIEDGPPRVEHVPVTGADEPFARYADVSRGS